jgi:hypothetical protein
MRNIVSPLSGIRSPFRFIRGGGVVPFSPSTLFASGEEGAWYEPSPTTCFTDTAGTIPATVGDAVARINDLSGNGNHAIQVTAAARPLLQQTAGGLYYLAFDGSDDTLVANLAMSTASMTAITALSTVHAPGNRYWSLRTDPINTGGLVNFLADAIANGYACGYRLPENEPTSLFTFSDNTNVVTTYLKSGTSSQSFSLNQGTPATNTATVTTFTSELFELSSQSSGAFGENNLFGLILVDRALTAQEISDTESYLAAKSGVVL